MSWTSSMGLVLKPRKCKSLSVKAGCPAAEEFKLGDYVTVPSLAKFSRIMGLSIWQGVAMDSLKYY